jgi:iron transport multicopper oxidase
MVGHLVKSTDGSGIPPGQSFEYNFSVGEQTGTYWIHSHVKGQYPNGLRAPFIVQDPDSPYHCDNEVVLSVSDWVFFPLYHLMIVQ